MSLSSTSNTINYLGIFGRLSPSWEKRFSDLESQYSHRPDDAEANNFFNHLSLVMNPDVPIGNLPQYIDLLKALKPHLPFTLAIDKVVVKENNHLALSFGISQTETIRNLATEYVGSGVVLTDYIKVVWYVVPEKQAAAITELKKIKSVEFSDFTLVANKQNDENTIYSSNRYQ